MFVNGTRESEPLYVVSFKVFVTKSNGFYPHARYDGGIHLAR